MGISRLPDHRLALAAIAPANHGAARAERSEPKVLEPQEFLSDRAGREPPSNQTYITCRRPARWRSVTTPSS